MSSIPLSAQRNPRRFSRLKSVFWLLVTIYAMVCLLMLNFETSMVYPAPRYPNDGDWNAGRFRAEDVHFSSADGTQLHGWYWDHPQPKAFVLYCHGNGDCVGYLGDYFLKFSQENAVSVFVFDYRGYGRSEGRPHEKGLLQDGAAARDWLSRHAGILPADVVLMGRSIGGGVAVHLAAQDGARGLILQNTFSSLSDVAVGIFPYLPVRWLMRNQYRSIDKIGNYQGPLLQSHGNADRVVPYELGRKLFAKAVGKKEFITIEGGDHNDPEPHSYEVCLRQFLHSSP
jgi:uncharacterized protein